LLLGTNIGGLGTLVASLASLISFKLYLKTEQAKPLRYLGVFTIVNIVFLISLLAFTMVFYI
ncbi:MAG: citrate transporter, partial [Anaerocolumna sp.]|nr:citrate transporter [Anaerocolumna sp.]